MRNGIIRSTLGGGAGAGAGDAEEVTQSYLRFNSVAGGRLSLRMGDGIEFFVAGYPQLDIVRICSRGAPENLWLGKARR